MKAVILTDGEFETEQFHSLYASILTYFKDYDLETININKGDLAYCIGCFGCWVQKPGECMISDLMDDINRKTMNSDVVITLSPVIYGQYSANIKNALDRWIPNVLPFFETRKDGSTMHPRRYKTYPKQLMIGYGEQLNNFDMQLFTDIAKKHRSNIDVFFWNNNEAQLFAALDGVTFERVGGQL